MERCAQHDLINCKCRETLAAFLVRQFSESVSDGVVRTRTWVSVGGAGHPDRGWDRDSGLGRGTETGGDR